MIYNVCSIISSIHTYTYQVALVQLKMVSSKSEFEATAGWCLHSRLWLNTLTVFDPSSSSTNCQRFVYFWSVVGLVWIFPLRS